jgi:hypothetical protein
MTAKNKGKTSELTEHDLDNVSGGLPGVDPQDAAGEQVGKMLFDEGMEKKAANSDKKKAAEAAAASSNLGGEYGVCPGPGSGVGPS